MCVTDDGWMDLSAEQLDAVLRKVSGQPTTFDSTLMAEAVSKFVEKTSSFEGAEFPRLLASTVSSI